MAWSSRLKCVLTWAHQDPAATPRRAFLTAAALLAVGVLLFGGFYFYPRTVEVSVCNEAPDAALEGVQVILASSQMRAPPARWASLRPGECRTVELDALHGESHARVGYRFGAATHTSELAYCEPGWHCRFAVRDLGTVEMEAELPGMLYPPFVLFGLAGLSGLLSALYALSGLGLLLSRHTVRSL